MMKVKITPFHQTLYRGVTNNDVLISKKFAGDRGIMDMMTSLDHNHSNLSDWQIEST